MSPRILVLSSATTVCVLSALSGFAQVREPGTTLRELARASGGKALVLVNPNVPFASLELVASGAETILQGRVLKAEPRLNADETDVLTYCTIAPIRVFKSATRPSYSVKPGPTEIALVMAGGTVHVEGLEISSIDKSGPDSPLQAGDEVIVFLTRMPDSELFRLYHGSYGLLRVRDGKVSAANKTVADLRPLETDDLFGVQRKIERLVK